MSQESNAIRQEITGVILFVGAIWAVFFASLVSRLDDTALSLGGHIGLVGIPPCRSCMGIFSTFWQHDSAVVLLILLAGSRAESWEVVVLIACWADFSLDLRPRGHAHRGQRADFGAYRVPDPFRFSGEADHPAFDRAVRRVLLWQFAPPGGYSALRFPISWDGHLCGAIAGGIVACVLARMRVRPSMNADRRLVCSRESSEFV